MSYANFNNGTLTFYYDNLSSTRTGTNYEMNEGSNDPAWSSVSSQIIKVEFDASFADARPTTTYKWFSDCTALALVTGTQYLNTSQVTNMVGMFMNCSALTSLDVGKFNTSNVTTMNVMFSGCSKLTLLNLSSFSTSKVTNMSGMFSLCSLLKKISLSYLFNTSNVENMGSMFYNCFNLSTIDLTYFDTSKVAYMNSMFFGCDSFTTLDLSKFNTGNVVNMQEMFRDCSNLTTIYVGSGWSTAKVSSSNNMFYYCSKIKGMAGTTYNASYVDKTYARLDEGTSKPGYLSTITYNLKVGGVEVTDMNKDNIPITSGTAKFNGTSLFLTDATIDGSLEYGSIYCTRDNMTISVSGTCTLNRSVIFHGADLYFTSNKDTDVLNVKSYFTFKGSLRFYNKNTVINNNSTYTFMGDGTTSKLEFGPKASLFAKSSGKQMVIQVTALTFKSPTGFTFGSLGVDDSQVSFDATQQTILIGGQPLQGILAVGQYYPLWFDTMQMSSTLPLYSKALFNQDVLSISEADDGTLVMKTYPEFPIYAYNNTTFRSEAENLRVELGSDWTVKMEDGSAANAAMKLYGNTTITGTGKLKVESAGIGIRIFRESHNLTIDGIDMEVTAAGNGIYGSSMLNNGVYSYYNGVTFKDATATITSSGSGESGYCLHHLNNLVLSGCQITNGVTFANNSIAAKQVVIGLGSSYDLNNDGKVSTADIQVIINEMKKPQASQNMDYDLNNDGKISTADIQVIINEMKK
ncbi:MAG: BspA family leucine-rich repeat surface protein [Prevotella sp.]|nr:BspA family leucine-rich repeat surface protein [Prevotella sp.]